MFGLLARLGIILIASLLTVAWFPTSLLPLWIVILAANFFSLREGTYMFTGFSIMSLIINASWWHFFIPLVLWLGLSSIIILTLLNTEKKVSFPVLFLICFLLSFGIQSVAAFGQLSNMLLSIIVITIKHLFLLAIIVFPVKILGEAYIRYNNALGINYE